MTCQTCAYSAVKYQLPRDYFGLRILQGLHQLQVLYRPVNKDKGEEIYSIYLVEASLRSGIVPFQHRESAQVAHRCECVWADRGRSEREGEVGGRGEGWWREGVRIASIRSSRVEQGGDGYRCFDRKGFAS